MAKGILSPQQSQAFAAVIQFPARTVRDLELLTLIPVATFHWRLCELRRLGKISKDSSGRYHAGTWAPSDPHLKWHPVNAMTFETATHRVRKVGDAWLAERKALDAEKTVKLGTHYESQADAETHRGDLRRSGAYFAHLRDDVDRHGIDPSLAAATIHAATASAAAEF